MLQQSIMVTTNCRTAPKETSETRKPHSSAVCYKTCWIEFLCVKNVVSSFRKCPESIGLSPPGESPDWCDIWRVEAGMHSLRLPEGHSVLTRAAQYRHPCYDFSTSCTDPAICCKALVSFPCAFPKAALPKNYHCPRNYHAP